MTAGRRVSARRSARPAQRHRAASTGSALPRTDIKATLDGVELKPGFALGGWLAFEKMGDQGMVMGDLVLTDGRGQPGHGEAAAGGIEITALHNHLLRNQPFTMYMHVLGHGDPVKLAAALHTALAESKTPLSAGLHRARPPAADRSRHRRHRSDARRQGHK